MALLIALQLPGEAAAQSSSQPCQYIRDFKRLHDLAPATIGECSSRRVFAPNGDIVQYTANGMIVKRKSDNWTAFTDGKATWIDGPRGLMVRLNGDSFTWERQTPGTPQQAARPQPRIGPAAAYPNAAFTPGSTDPRISERNMRRTICSAEYLAREPDPSYATHLKIRQIARYGYVDTNPASYEEDHFLPVALGGDPDAPSNMWPQPYSPLPGATEKNQVEVFLADQVCSGTITLAAAQQAILNDWVAVYQQLPKGR